MAEGEPPAHAAGRRGFPGRLAGAKELRRPPDDIESWVRRHGDLAGILTGDQPVLFQAVPDSFQPGGDDEDEDN